MFKTITRIPVAHYSNLKERKGFSIKIDQIEIALFKLSNGKIFAIENRSPHPKGGVLSKGIIRGEYLYCPVCDLKISLADGKVQELESGKVRTFKVEIKENIVFIVL
ncbi:nitrite reductase small subunit NirD [Bacillus salipaludis]|uniref:nitrite reductase small subunit NirD n=1 Tax=Bacillus salipaludis TaxID=2547811 RepID=UPI002E23C767|nr:nitrite reductase small subunit NirD [Bacillus salipaludis]